MWFEVMINKDTGWMLEKKKWERGDRQKEEQKEV